MCTIYLPVSRRNSLGSYPLTGKEASRFNDVVLWKAGFSKAAFNELTGGAMQRSLSSLNTM